MTSLQIGKAIHAILAENNIQKVYPLVADVGTTFPFIVYRRTGLEPASTKDRYNYQELATVEIIVAADNYIESIELAERVKNILEHTRGTYNNIKVGEITFKDSDEDFIEDTFIQKLIFNIQIL